MWVSKGELSDITTTPLYLFRSLVRVQHKPPRVRVIRVRVRVRVMGTG